MDDAVGFGAIAGVGSEAEDGASYGGGATESGVSAQEVRVRVIAGAAQGAVNEKSVWHCWGVTQGVWLLVLRSWRGLLQAWVVAAPNGAGRLSGGLAGRYENRDFMGHWAENLRYSVLPVSPTFGWVTAKQITTNKLRALWSSGPRRAFLDIRTLSFEGLIRHFVVVYFCSNWTHLTQRTTNSERMAVEVLITPFNGVGNLRRIR